MYTTGPALVGGTDILASSKPKRGGLHATVTNVVMTQQISEELLGFLDCFEPIGG